MTCASTRRRPRPSRSRSLSAGSKRPSSSTGGAEIIQTTSAAVTSTIDTNQILKIPTGSRSALEFVALLPGVSTPGGPGGSRDSTVNGLPQSAINITIDGMSAQDNHLKTGDGFFARVSPRLDAIEEVTVNSAAQDASSTGQGAVQIRFVTRSGSNQFTGSGYYYLQHYKLNANTWFNNRDNAPKADDVLHQPGGRIGGPIMIPGSGTAATRRSSSSTTKSRARRERTPRTARCCTRAPSRAGSATPPAARRARSTCSRSPRRTASCSTIDPTIGRLLGDIRASTAGSTVVDNTDPLTQNLTYSYQTDSVTKYPTGRSTCNVTDKHRLSWSMTYTDLVSTPDTTNNREPNFPGFPNTGSQVSDRYITRGTLRSTLGANLVNEFTVGGSGGATMFSPRDRGEPVQRHAGRRPGRVPPEHQHRRRHHERGLDRRLLGARGFDEGHREHAELAARARTTSRRAARGPGPTCGCRISSTCRR